MIAIIPARSGSKGVPGKNIKLLGGIPLFAFSIIAAKMMPSVSRVILSTDSEEYAQIAIEYGAEVPFLRPNEISGDKSTDFDLFLHALNWFKENEKLIKFGHSNNLQLRLSNHRKDYNNFVLIDAFRVQNKVEIENLIKNHEKIKKQIRTIEVDGKNKTEIICYDDTNFTIDNIIKNINNPDIFN
jgi:hypothetical protein